MRHNAPCGQYISDHKLSASNTRSFSSDLPVSCFSDGYRPVLPAWYRDIAPVVQHQIVQHSPSSIEARLVVERALTNAEEKQLREKILERLGYAYELKFSYPQKLERSISGKFEEFLCLVA